MEIEYNNYISDLQFSIQKKKSSTPAATLPCLASYKQNSSFPWNT